MLNSFSIISSEVESIRFLTYRIFTEDIVSSSTSTSGSAQSTAIGCPHSWILPVEKNHKHGELNRNQDNITSVLADGLLN